MLVRDIVTTPSEDLNITELPFRGLVSFRGGLLFVGRTSQGTGLWASDGTAAGTRLLREIDRGDHSFLAVGSRVAFFAERHGSGRLWRSDGTASGTYRLGNGAIPSGFIARQRVFDAARQLLFYTDWDAEHGIELWVSDGTKAGTRLLVDLNEGPAYSEPQDLRLVGSRLWFTAMLVGQERELLILEPGEFVPRRVTAGLPAAQRPAFPAALAPFGDTMIFRGTTSSAGTEPWVSDGTVSGTRMLKDVVPGPAGGQVTFDMVSTSAGVIFVAVDPVHGEELWRTDGTTQGTRRLTFLQPARPFPLQANVLSIVVVEVGGVTYFAADDGVHGTELWRTNGTTAGTRMVTDLCPGSCSSNPWVSPYERDRVFFLGDNGVLGEELWTTDGTAGGTRLVADACPGPCDSLASVISRMGRRWLFVAIDSTVANEGYDLWLTDGTPQGSRRLSEPGRLTGDSTAFFVLAPLGDGVAFSAGTSGFNGELFVVDAAASAVETITRFEEPEPGGAQPTTVVEAFGRGFFFARNPPSFERPMWSSDGSMEGTQPLPNVPRSYFDHESSLTRLGSRLLWSDQQLGELAQLWALESASASPRLLGPGPDRAALTPLGNQAFYAVLRDLWVTDGTPAGTRLLDHEVIRDHAIATEVATAGGLFFFVGSLGHLGVSDGTSAGTRTVLPDLSIGLRLHAAGDLVFFAGRQGVSPYGLWRSDGSADGTFEVRGPADQGFELEYGVGEVGGRFLFLTRSAEGGFDLWSTGGTTVSTTRLLAGTGGTFLEEPTGRLECGAATLGRELLFCLDDGVHGLELWATDGTATGTRMVKDLLRGIPAGFPSDLRRVGSRVYFSADDGAAGRELWVTDGTEAGTRMLFDLEPGARSSAPGPVSQVGSKLFFSAFTQESGRELWSLALADEAIGPCLPNDQTLCLQDGRFRVRAHFRDQRSGNQGNAGAMPYGPESGFFWFFRPSNIELVVKVVDGRLLNEHFWSFYGALSDVEYWVEVTDLETAQSRVYHNPPGEICGLADTTSIPEDPVEPRRRELEAGELRGWSERGWSSWSEPRAASGLCAPSDTTLCLLDGRFALEVDWRNQRNGDTGVGHTISGTSQTGNFWFFNPAKLELVVKMLDGALVNGKFWVFYGALSDVEYTIRVTDTTTGAVKTYRNPPGNVCGGADTEAF